MQPLQPTRVDHTPQALQATAIPAVGDAEVPHLCPFLATTGIHPVDIVRFVLPRTTPRSLGLPSELDIKPEPSEELMEETQDCQDECVDAAPPPHHGLDTSFKSTKFETSATNHEYDANYCIANRKHTTGSTYLTKDIGEKPYACELCDKQFTRNNSLSKHVRIHSGEKPYSCKLCDKKFTRNDILKQHERTHTVNLKGPYNNAFRKDLGRCWGCRASGMFAVAHEDGFSATLRKRMV
ncbi:zinc-finger double domain-containing protein [Phthorimaea operculella]|nr:zinc-finger double domain-containing protein [Phthorimaea operculella]